jgi:hypothetical protein
MKKPSNKSTKKSVPKYHFNTKSNKSNKSNKSKSSKRNKLRGSGTGSSKQKTPSNPFEELYYIEQKQSTMPVSEKIATIKKLAPNLGKMLPIDKAVNDMTVKELLATIAILEVNKGTAALEKPDLVALLTAELSKTRNVKIDKMLSDVVENKRNKLLKERDEREAEQRKKNLEIQRAAEKQRQREAEQKKFAEEQRQREAEQKKFAAEQQRIAAEQAHIREVERMGDEARRRQGYYPPPPPYQQRYYPQRYYQQPPPEAYYHKADSLRELYSIPPELRQGDNYDPEKFADFEADYQY